MIMSDPLLSSLCGICHINAPKYKCPRCGARTCSLPCIKKHKNWSTCNGERDPTVFIPASKLRTDAGIDHDYNFLTKIERTVERVEKILTEERGILPQRKDGPPPNKKARLHKGQSRGRTTVGDNLRPWAKQALSRLQALHISVMLQPYGMSRAKENATSFNKRTGSINWQVEWLLMDPDSSALENTKPVPTRILGKTLDTTPLYVGFMESQERQRFLQLNKEDREKEKKGKRLAKEGQEDDWENGQTTQNADSSAWRNAPENSQDSRTGCWNMLEDSRKRRWQEWLARKEKHKYRFFFHVPGIPSRETQKLIPTEPADTLEYILKGSEVLEFPTIYVLPTGSRFPEGFMLAERTREEPKEPKKKHQKGGATDSKKRKSSTLVEYGSSEEEEGEVHDPSVEYDGKEKLTEPLDGERDEEEEEEEDDDTSSSGSDSSDMDVD
jgi:hypothetical protein